MHEHLLRQHLLRQHLLGPMDLQQMQADEIRVKAQGGLLWMAVAICITTRLWLGRVVAPRRDRHLIRAVALQVRACALCRPVWVVFDGFSAYVKAFRRAFRSPLVTGKRGRPALIEWPSVVLGLVIKSRQGRRLKAVTRRVVERGCVLVPGRHSTAQDRAHRALIKSSGGLNTSYIERFNATFRGGLSALVRQTRGLVREPLVCEPLVCEPLVCEPLVCEPLVCEPLVCEPLVCEPLVCEPARLRGSMYLVGCVYTMCTYHESVSVPLVVSPGSSERVHQVRRTPAMVASVTDHRWSVYELLSYRVRPNSRLHG